MELISVIKKLEEKITENLTETEYGLSFVDPVDKEEISAHYAMSHTAAGMIMLAKYTNDTPLYEKGCAVLNKIVNTYSEDSKLYGYHDDFNNFALCLLYNYLDDGELKRKTADVIVNSADSKHLTINWMPMRMYANLTRFKLTGDKRYMSAFSKFENKVKSAVYTDGFTDDRIPPDGASFCPQYHIFTTAVLSLLKDKTSAYSDEMMGAAVKIQLPDGDINYFGRGTNQIFAWGPWLYLSKGTDVWDKSFSFFSEHIDKTLYESNIMLNDRPGSEKYLWYSYHYSSVYTAHLYMWLVLAYIKKDIENPVIKDENTSGVNVYRNDEVFAVTFEGRSEYLSENAQLAALYTKKYGMIFKGSFGPWQKFAEDRELCDTVIHNFVGILCKAENTRLNENRVLKKAHITIDVDKYLRLMPYNFAPDVKIDGKKTVLTWKSEKALEGIFNFPVMCNENLSCVLRCDGEEYALIRTGAVCGVYGEMKLFQSRTFSAKQVELTITL